MLAQPRSSATSASRVGDAASARVSISFDFEMSQFWQNRQARLQPAVPNDRTDDPGRKWFSGFFSIGSTQNPLDRPYVVSTIWSSSRARTKHTPRWPSRSLHARGQTSHWMRPSSRTCQYFVGTVVLATRSSPDRAPRATGYACLQAHRSRHGLQAVGEAEGEGDDRERGVGGAGGREDRASGHVEVRHAVHAAV